MNPTNEYHRENVRRLAKDILRVRYDLTDDFNFEMQPSSWDCEIKDVEAGLLIGFDLGVKCAKANFVNDVDFK